MSTDSTGAGIDVVDLLKAQHAQIRGLFAAVESAPASGKQVAFDELRRFLAVHETAEEMVVHPAVERHGATAKSVVDARLHEEHDAKEVLSGLDGMKADDPTFDAQLAALKAMVVKHASNEESEEFPLLRQHGNEKELRDMALAVEAAEKIAPTHPHPGVESFTANLVAGPLASVVDRTRDAIRSVLDRPR